MKRSNCSCSKSTDLGTTLTCNESRGCKSCKVTFPRPKATARKAFKDYGYSAPERAGPTLVTLAEVIFEQGRYEEAEELTARAINLYASDCMKTSSIQVAAAKHWQARALMAQGQWKNALDVFDAIERGVRTEQPTLFESRFSNDPDWGFALLKANRAREALTKLESAYERNLRGLGNDHEVSSRTQAFLAIAYAQTGNEQRAVELFRESIPKLLDAWKQRTHDGAYTTNRGQELRLIIEAFVILLDKLNREGKQAEVGEDPVDLMFRMVDAARGGSVQKSLVANRARAAAVDPALANLVGALQSGQQRMESLQRALLVAVMQPVGDQDRAVIQQLQDELANERVNEAKLTAEIERHFPRYASFINASPPTLAQVRQHLRPRESLLSVFVGEQRTYVWAIPKAGPVAYGSSELGARELTSLVGTLRTALEPEAETLGDIPQFDTHLAHRLYRALLEPVRRGWQDANTLLVITDGALSQLPLSVLPVSDEPIGVDTDGLFSGYRDVAWLAREHAVVTLPSAASLILLRGVSEGTGRAAQPFIGFGDPWFSPEHSSEVVGESTERVAELDSRGLALRRRFSPQTRGVDSAELSKLPRLPETADEVRQMAAALKADPATSVYLGRQASEAQVKRLDLKGRRVLAFATHGLVAGDLNGLTQPALAMSSPTVTGGNEDGLLTMGEILGLELNADWVVLSACNTAAGEGAGAEAISGPGRAFFYAGARSLLVTQWPVETNSAKQLTTEVFRLQSANRALSRGEALQQAMVAMIDGPGYVPPEGGESLFAYAHPIFWVVIPDH